MTPLAWTTLLTAWTVAVASPGPDFLAVLHTSLRRGRAAGALVACGVVAGITLWLAAALTGASMLLSGHATLYLLIRWAGAVFLILYGASILRGAWRKRRDGTSAAAAATAAPEPVWHSVRRGFLTNTIGNPKALVFFGALFASILPPGTTTTENLLVGAVMAAIGLGWFLLVAAAARLPAVVSAYRRAEGAVTAVLGALFVVLGIVLAPGLGL
ncbi:LysE family translocator [Zhihengliuella halotolerans]|uniref:Threonine/homoserine/homoserine lactone efflux protein n=1 Tax=Zhihengliuella halotolerans TaxID=370736 RepID=A0A4Q8AB48_9MICC|nr:LysE family transporter [Zhihengliuella halotolerans]RZU60871.1 threonine/homoserine/homoserine lactone efflux protein [Zhihengliuella halotolerans]